MQHVKQPEQVGEILRELFIIRPDGSIDHDLVVAYARAAESDNHSKKIAT